MSNNFLEKIKQEQNKLKGSLCEETEELKFLEEFITKNRFNSIKNLLDVNLCELMIAYICSNSKEFEYDEVKMLIDSNKNLIENSDANTFERTLSIMFYTLEHQDKEKQIINIQKTAKKRLLDSKINDYIKYTEEDNDIDMLISFIKEDKDVALHIFAIVESFKEINQEQENMNDSINEFSQEVNVKISDKNKDRFYKRGIKALFNIRNIQEEIKTIQNYYDQEKRKIKSNNKKIIKEITKLQELESKFTKELKKEEITKIDELVNLVSNSDLKKELLKEIYNHNLPVWENLNSKYNNLSKDHINQVKILFNKYGFNYDELKINCTNIELSDLEYYLKVIKKYKINDSQILKYIINNSSKEIIETIDSLIKNSVLTIDFVISNKDILNKDYNRSMFPVLIKNIKSLKDNNINPKLFFEDQDSLLIDIDLFNNNLNILNEYELKDTLKNSKQYQFLASNELDSLIDKILELGYEQNLEENLDLLNYDINKWNKVLIYKMIGENITETEELLNILNSNDFDIENSSEEFLFNFIDYLNNDDKMKPVNIDMIKKHITPNRTYDFNGVLISKNKVEKIYKSNGELKVEDIIKNSILTEDEYTKVIDCIKIKTK